MKTIFFLLFTYLSFSQTYNVVAVGDFYNVTKLNGTATITDAKYTVSFENGKTSEFDVVSNKNGTIYITDGVMTDWLNIIEEKGKKKGKEYSKIIIINFDIRRNLNTKVLYYCE